MTTPAARTPTATAVATSATPAMRLHFELNGAPCTLNVPAGRRLLDLLREDLGLVGAKPGCGVGRCGACMVWLDDEPVNACLLMAWQLPGRRVTTIEGLAGDARAVPVRVAMAEAGAVQCGYCAPGMVMSLTWLHAQPTPCDRTEAAAQLCGNLCRCTGYGGLQRTLDRLFGPSEAASSS